MAKTEHQDPIQSRDQFDDNPTGWATYWNAEMVAFNKRTYRWHKRGRKTVARYVDRRGQGPHADLPQETNRDSDGYDRVNLFNANITTVKSMMYGQTPQIDVDRRFHDADDDVARVAAVMLERIINTSIEAPGDRYKDVLDYALTDYLVPGMGIARVRYESDFTQREVEALVDEESGEEIAPAYTEEQLNYENSPIDYVHWEDFAWGYARVWSEIPWQGFRSFMTRDQANERFGKKIARQLQYGDPDTKDMVDSQKTSEEAADAWQRAVVWEIWDLRTQKVFWWSKGCPVILDQKDDPLGLDDFFPSPRALVANCVTDQVLPTPDFMIAKDLYNEIDLLESRITTITKAIRVTGVYDSQHDDLKRMLEEGVFDNQLYPVDNWAVYAEKGGLKGSIDFMPIGEIAGVLRELVAARDDAKANLYEVTGIADIIRGAAGPDRETATAAGEKSKFASVRIQAKQEQFEKFAAELMQLRCEVIAKHYDPETIVVQSNAMALPEADRRLVPQAIELIKQYRSNEYRIKVAPDSLSRVDYAQRQRDSAMFIDATAKFLQQAGPLVQFAPGSAPFLLQLLQHALAGFKGANEAEGILDAAIRDLKENPPQQNQDDGGEAAERAKAEGAIQLEKVKHQNKMAEKQLDIQGDLRKLAAELDKELKTIIADAEADTNMEQQQMVAAIKESRAAMEHKLQEIEAAHLARMRELNTQSDNQMDEREQDHRFTLSEQRQQSQTNGSGQV